jgi:hypothetical protein
MPPPKDVDQIRDRLTATIADSFERNSKRVAFFRRYANGLLICGAKTRSD